MAAKLRLLLHDNPSGGSRGLLHQLGLQSHKFFDTAKHYKTSPGVTRITPFVALASLRISTDGSPGCYDPHFDDLPGYLPRETGFADYWEEPIIEDSKGNTFNREWLIRRVANQDGGAHVDPGLSADYMDLTKRNSLGWTYSHNGSDWFDVEGIGFVCIRQIAHEILRTFLPDRYQAGMLKSKNTITSVSINIGDVSFIPEEQCRPNYASIRRKGPCPCGSGKKYKRCCGN